MAHETCTHCPVCGKKLSSSSYWPVACQNCMSYFRKTINGILSLPACQFQSCTVYWNIKPVCRHCRIKKCFELGLKMNGFFQKEVKTTQNQIRQTLAELCGSEIDNRPVKRQNNNKQRIKSKRLEIDDSERVKSNQRRLSAAVGIAQKEARFFCADCHIEFETPIELFRHLRMPHANNIEL